MTTDTAPVTVDPAPVAPKPQSDALKRANEARAKAAHDRAEARKAAEAEEAANAPEQVDGFSLFYPDGVARYRSDSDGYQTAYAAEARAYRRNHPA